jgi:TetR/AcrR family transcriptional regulator
MARFFHAEVIEPNALLFGSIIARGIDSGAFRPIDVPTAVHLWIAPLVTKAIWAHSIERCVIVDDAAQPQRLLDVHVDLILAALRPQR